LEKFKIEIINVLGQVVYNEIVESYIVNTNKKIDIKLIEGTYIVNIENDKEAIQVPIIVE